MAPVLASHELGSLWASNSRLFTRMGAPFTSCSSLRRPFTTVCGLGGQRNAVACRATMVASAGAQTTNVLPEESYDAEVQVLDPGAVSSHMFEQHDLAMGKLEELQELIATMQQMSTVTDPEDSLHDLGQLVTAMQQLSSAADAELKKDREWNGDAISAPTHKEMLRAYRDSRKAEEAKRRSERRLSRVLRTAGISRAAALHDSSYSLTPQQQLQQLDQQQLPAQQPAPLPADGLSFAERQSVRQRRKQERGAQSAAEVAAEHKQQHIQLLQPQDNILVQPALQQQQQHDLLQPKKQQHKQPAEPSRLRRRRSSTSAVATATSPAALQDNSSTSIRQSQPELQPAARRGRPPKGAPAAVSAAAGVLSPQLAPGHHLTVDVLSVAAAGDVQPSREGSGSSGSPVRQGFVPLVLNRGTAPRSNNGASTAARRLRVPGARPTNAVTAAAASAVAAVPVPGTVKLSENNINGLDMRADLLSADQEKELAVMVQDLLYLERVGRELQVSLGHPPSDLEWMEAAGCPATEQEPREAVQQFQARLQHGRAAKQVMISANYKLVVSICRKYQGYGLSLGDLINEGVAGLVKGVERFEPSKGCKFSTYAHWWIRQSVTRSLSDQGRLVRLPSHLQEMLTKMTRISRTFEAQYGREPSLQDLARELGVDASKIADAYDAVFTPRSLDQPMGDGEGATLGDILEDERMLDAEGAAHIESLKHDMEAVLANLNAREAGVLRMRFGLLDGTERTLDEIGAQYNVTRERIRQIEAKAIRQLRARQMQPGSLIADYHEGQLEGKQLASRTSSGTKKQG